METHRCSKSKYVGESQLPKLRKMITSGDEANETEKVSKVALTAFVMFYFKKIKIWNK